MIVEMHFSCSLLSTVCLCLLLLIWLQIVSSTTTRSPYLEIYPADDQLNGTTTRSIYFALIMSFPKSQFLTHGAVPAVRVALDRINEDPYLLQNYTLRYTLSNSSCDRTVALTTLFDQMRSPPTKLAVVGAGCSVATEPTSEVSHFFNVTQISCATSSSEQRDRVRFPRYFQMLPTEDSMAFAYLAVIKKYGWKKVAIIVQDESLFTKTVEKLKTLLTEGEIEYSEKIFRTKDGLGDDPFGFDPQARIFIIRMYTFFAKRLLCEAHSRGFTYPQYTLLTIAWYPINWWVEDDQMSSLPCTTKERESVLKLSLGVVHLDTIQDLNKTTTSGITGTEYFEEKEKYLNKPPFFFPKREHAWNCYDTVWALAYALNRTIEDINLKNLSQEFAEIYLFNNTNDSFHLDQFSYSNDGLTNIMFDNLRSTNFDGLGGNVTFDDDGIRLPNRLLVYQYRRKTTQDSVSLDRTLMAYVFPDRNNDSNAQFEYLIGETDSTVWPDGFIPSDGVPKVKEVSVHPAVTAIFTILAIIGIMWSIACLTFSFMFRKKSLVRLTSPNLNILIGAGAIVLYIDIFFTVIPSTKPTVVAVFCNLTIWLTAIGYSLCYGTIVAKMCRVYYIFSNSTTQKIKVIKDWTLAVGVLLLVLIDLVILITYTAVDGSRGNLSSHKVSNRENPEDISQAEQIITQYFIYVCDSKARDYALGILYGYKALLQVVALLFAFSTRKVKIKGLNDSVYIAAAIYVTSIVTAVIIFTNYYLQEDINRYAAVTSLGLLIGTTFILILVFVPVMIGLYKDPEGKTVFSQSAGNQGTLSEYQTQQTQQTMESLRRRVKELEEIVTEKKSDLDSNEDGVMAHITTNANGNSVTKDVSGGGMDS